MGQRRKEVRREVPYLLDRVNCLACTYLSRDSVGVNSTKVQDRKSSLLLEVFLRRQRV